jgi:hypothetical protein
MMEGYSMSKPLFTVDNLSGESPVPAEVQVNPKWGKEFSHAHGVVFRLAPKATAYLFIHDSLQSDDPKDVNHILGNDSIVGYVLNCEGQEWTIKTEATSEGKFGLIVYTMAGKPYMAGEGQFDASGRWSAKFATLYPGIRNTKPCHLQGGIKGGTGQRTETQIGGTCGGTF